MVKNLPAKQETQVQSLDREDPLELGMATHSSILAWSIPWTEEPGRLQAMGLQTVGHDWVINTNMYKTTSHNCILWMKSIKLRKAVTCKAHTVRNVWGSQSHIRTFSGPSLQGEGNFPWQTCQESTSSYKTIAVALSFPRKLLIHFTQHSCSSSPAGDLPLVCHCAEGWLTQQTTAQYRLRVIYSHFVTISLLGDQGRSVVTLRCKEKLNTYASFISSFQDR